jgi:superfamily II DNA helicase RecQ
MLGAISTAYRKRLFPVFVTKNSSTNQKDVISALKTGYGKSLIFESLAYYKTGNTSPTIIIVSPLNAIINEQLERNGENKNSSTNQKRAK